MTVERALFAAAKVCRDRLRAEAAVQRGVHDDMVAEAVRDHVALPEHYWQARQIAEEKARCAERIAEALRP